MNPGKFIESKHPVSKAVRKRNPELFPRASDHRVNAPIPDAKQCECPPSLAWDSAGEAPSASCPLVRFRLCRVKLLDVDAKYSSVKDLLDGLAAAGLIHGDQEGQVCLEVEQERVTSYALEKTVIEITL